MKKLAMVMIALVMMAACSEEPSKPAQAEKKGPDLLTARTAFQKMFIQARGWQRDATPFRLESQFNADSKGRDGKSAIWRASFASPLQRSLKVFMWSGTDATDAPSRGVSFGTEDTYSPSNSSTLVWDVAFLKVDSDKAFSVAQQHGGDKVLEKNPDLPVFYIVDWNRAENELTWHVIYGNSRDEAKLKVAVNASTGEYLRVEK